MRRDDIAGIALRVVVAGTCIICSWQAIRFARIDWLAADGTFEGLQKAVSMDPKNPALLARVALTRNENGDNSPEVDEEMRQVLRINPLDSRILIALGLREEFHGDSVGAERELKQAVVVDHQYTPAWTLAGYYVRSDQPDKFWPVVQHVLLLDPLAVDLRPLFDLCWHETEDPAKIASVLPRRDSILVPYLQFLVETKRIDAAALLTPSVLAVADRTSVSDRDQLLNLIDLLLEKDRTKEAVDVWNQLVDRGMILNGKLNPGNGESLADPGFQYPLITRAFAWKIEMPPGIAGRINGSARFELDGNQPEKALMLSTIAAVTPGHAYRLSWKSDSTRLASPNDPGFILRVRKLAECHPAQSASGSCDFEVPAAVDHVPVELWYERALGTVRAQGVFQLTEVQLKVSR